jgi:hypothetical protein
MKRVFGIFSIVGGFLIALAQLWLQFDSQSFIAAYFHLVGLVSIAIGLIGLYLIQYKFIGGFGFFSFALLSISLHLWIGYHWFQTFVYLDLLKSFPDMIDTVSSSMIYGKNLALYSLLSSILIFSGISLWKGILSRWSTALLFLAPFTILIPYGSISAYSLAGVSFIWSGITLCKGNTNETGIGTETEVRAENPLQELQEKKLEANQ